MKMRWRHP